MALLSACPGSQWPHTHTHTHSNYDGETLRPLERTHFTVYLQPPFFLQPQSIPTMQSANNSLPPGRRSQLVMDTTLCNNGAVAYV